MFSDIQENENCRKGELKISKLSSLKTLSILNLLRKLKQSTRRRLSEILLQVSAYLVKQKCRSTIISGIFEGVRFTNKHVYGSPIAKILGTYEMELYPALTYIGKGKFRRVINVGGAEGYYAVGAAVKWNVEHVIVFEALRKGRQLIDQIAHENNVSKRVNIKGYCQEEDLYRLTDAESRDIVIIDVEGMELEILSERVLAKLRKSMVIVEAHDFVHPGCTEELKVRMAKNHGIEMVCSKVRRCSDFPLGLPLPRMLKLSMMDEGRPGPMNWLIGMPLLKESENT